MGAGTQNMVDILHAWAPYIDSAYCVSAPYISDRSTRNAFVTLFETTCETAMRVADLLFIQDVADARAEDQRFIRHLFNIRSRQNRITVVDTLDGLKPKREI